MAIETLIKAASIADIEQILRPLHQKGCKITLGAGITLPPPSLATALQLVRAKRASSRILQPIAATRLQRAWVRHLELRKEQALQHSKVAQQQAEAAITLQSAWLRHTVQAAYAKQQRAALRISAAMRGAAQRRAYCQALEEVGAPLCRIQAAVRGWLARAQLRSARTAARAVQATWRRVRCQVLRRRLARAANALRAGGKLEKYRKRKGAQHERHQRFAWVSEDLQHFLWSPVVDRFDEDAVKVRSIPMASITAVTEGVKTPLLKKMEKRAADPSRTLSFKKPLQMGKPLALDEHCAFSIISNKRVIDFYAPDQASRDAWLRDLKTALTYGHTYDHKAAIAAVGKLAAEPTKASDSDTDDE